MSDQVNNFKNWHHLIALLVRVATPDVHFLVNVIIIGMHVHDWVTSSIDQLEFAPKIHIFVWVVLVKLLDRIDKFSISITASYKVYIDAF